MLILSLKVLYSNAKKKVLLSADDLLSYWEFPAR